MDNQLRSVYVRRTAATGLYVRRYPRAGLLRHVAYCDTTARIFAESQLPSTLAQNNAY